MAACARDTDGRLDATRFSFRGEEYVHPLIVRELLGWISDSSATIVGVDLEAANRSNRFYGDFAIVDDPDQIEVVWNDGESAFGYRYVATTPSGVEIVECHDRLGGSSPMPDWMIYGTYASGFRPGIVNTGIATRIAQLDAVRGGNPAAETWRGTRISWTCRKWTATRW